MGGPGQEGVQLFRVAAHGADIKDLLDLILEGNITWEVGNEPQKRKPNISAAGMRTLAEFDIRPGPALCLGQT